MVPRRSRSARLLFAELTVSELREFVRSRRVLSLFARWELNKRVVEAKMIETGGDSLKLSSEFWDDFFDATQKMYESRTPDRWEQLARSMHYKSNGTLDLTPGFLADVTNPEDDVRCELDVDKSTLVVTSGERQVKVRGTSDSWLIDCVAVADQSRHLIVLIPTLPNLAVLVGSASQGGIVDATEFSKIETNWVSPRVGLLECFPMPRDDGKLIVYYATYQQIGIVEIDLNTGRSHNHFCSSTSLFLLR
ncbi:hypothetical protein CGZ80_06965 [Rhodopirellula sp. MGV]|nr:hypothetical protein CGZ80_06965 [Rhodopirellula sp. MGV]